MFSQEFPLWQNILILDKIFFNGKISMFFRKSFPLWQNILILDKKFIDGKIFLFSLKFSLWQNTLILDKIFIDGDPPRLLSQATKHQTVASSHLELNRKILIC